tara:strand:+ start:44 stop:604 length:561 start_codon:yes stop_codon:yes gene_type:complete
MNTKNLFIYEYQILFEILNEISENLDFKIIELNKNDLNSKRFEQESNFLIISSEKHNHLENCFVLEKTPLKLTKFIELININFLKSKFLNQSDFKIGEYKLDLNSRKISLKNKSINLTEREINLIIFIYQERNVGIKEIQKKVWYYSSNLETHTVETHIYRLRKKIKDAFNDDEFILYEKDGYCIK